MGGKKAARNEYFELPSPGPPTPFLNFYKRQFLVKLDTLLNPNPELEYRRVEECQVLGFWIFILDFISRRTE